MSQSVRRQPRLRVTRFASSTPLTTCCRAISGLQTKLRVMAVSRTPSAASPYTTTTWACGPSSARASVQCSRPSEEVGANSSCGWLQQGGLPECLHLVPKRMLMHLPLLKMGLHLQAQRCSQS